MVKNPPAMQGDTGSIPGQGTKIPHAAKQLSPHAATTEPAHSGAHVPQLESSRAACTEAHVLWSPRTTTRESAHRNKRSQRPQLRPDTAK